MIFTTDGVDAIPADPQESTPIIRQAHGGQIRRFPAEMLHRTSVLRKSGGACCRKGLIHPGAGLRCRPPATYSLPKHEDLRVSTCPPAQNYVDSRDPCGHQRRKQAQPTKEGWL